MLPARCCSPTQEIMARNGDGAERIAERLAEREGVSIENARAAVEAAGTYGPTKAMSDVLREVKQPFKKGT